MGYSLGRVMHGALCSNSKASSPPAKAASFRDAAKTYHLSPAGGRETAQPINARQAVIAYVGTAHVELICHLLGTALGKGAYRCRKGS